METATAHISRRCRPLVASAVLVPALLLVLALHAPAAAGRAAKGAEFTQSRIVGHQPAVRPSYGWPVKPFNRQHPFRGYLNDPRGHDFHFGIDISARDGTPVYAVEAGQVFLENSRAVGVTGAARTFSYWHIEPAVRSGQRVRLHQLLGHITAGARHVHFAERVGGVCMNPLHPGGIVPYVDRTPPTVSSVEFLRNGREVDAKALTGRFDIVVEAFDTTPMLVPEPWSRLPVTPMRIRWSLSYGARSIVLPQTAVDSSRQLPRERFDSIYAPGTVPNRPHDPGHYRFYLARGFRASQLPTGIGRVRIAASDTRGNRVVANVKVAAAGKLTAVP
jgi:murein DD-endopeptidase MepM/ murein hydrolase activator NlpD